MIAEIRPKKSTLKKGRLLPRAENTLPERQPYKQTMQHTCRTRDYSTRHLHSRFAVPTAVTGLAGTSDDCI